MRQDSEARLPSVERFVAGWADRTRRDEERLARRTADLRNVRATFKCDNLNAS